ncbi:MAG TPA: prepilin-type N-terminal cleavage/methylation domain-containing protein, partial [Acidimicrobiales bacterium]|nr:prepilin-type N-terminal cleavage/methylation domain-containing protein [Acidimicrobiales bacterium]
MGVRKVQRRGRRLHGQPPAHDASWARSPRRLSEKSDEGFTLIELLIVLVILPLVVGAITMVLITTLKNDQSVQGTVADSNAATDSSAFYVRDIQSAAAVTTTASPSAPAPCGAGGAGFLLGLQLQGTVAPAAPSEVSYYESTPGGGPPELVREYCTNGSSTPQSREILSDNVSTTNPPTAVVNCASPTPTSIPTGVTCDPGHDWTPSYMLSTVSLNVTQGCSTVGACAPYQYSLTGDPQSGVPIPPLNEPCGVLTLLGTGPDINLGYNVLGNEALNA